MTQQKNNTIYFYFQNFDTNFNKMKSKLISKVSELESLKSENISAELAQSKSIIGGDDEKNISKSGNIFADNNLSQYLVHKNIDQVLQSEDVIASEKINDNTLAYTNNLIFELLKANTETSSKISNEIIINKTNKDNKLDTFIKFDILSIIPENVTPHLAQVNNSTPLQLNHILKFRWEG